MSTDQSLFEISDLISALIPNIHIEDLINFSRVNSKIYNIYNKINFKNRIFIELHKFRLKEISYLYLINTYKNRYQINYDLTKNNSAKIKKNLNIYKNFGFPPEYIILLKLLIYYNILTINIVQYEIIQESLTNNPIHNNLIPLFFIRDISDRTDYQTDNFKIIMGKYISYDLKTGKFRIDSWDPGYKHSVARIKKYYGLFSIYKSHTWNCPQVNPIDFDHKYELEFVNITNILTGLIINYLQIYYI